MSNSLNIWFKFALQQLAAESHLDGISWDDPEQISGRLFRGNTRPPFEPSSYSRVPTALADEFLADYRIIAHHANDATGFSGTLLRWTNEEGGQEFTLSIRSTEYKKSSEGGDRERDNLTGANGEIITRGFALGQLAALEDFYQREVLPLVGTAKINVTGYSLGGHLATVFTETHADRVKAAYVYNSAGRGELVGQGGTTAERMLGMVEYFRAMLTTEPSPDVFAMIPANDPRRSTYQYLYAMAYQAHLNDPAWNPFASNDARAYDDPRYRWAWAMTVEVGGYLSMSRALPRAGLGTAGDALITSIHGAALDSDVTLVANSQVHAPDKNAVFIEGQPRLELPSSSDERFDFANTHAITLLVDSLALQREFMRLDPSLTQTEVESIIKASSARMTKSVAAMGDSEAAEGDSLEKALFALSRAFDANAREVPSDATPGGFGNIGTRQSYFEQLAALPRQGAYRIEVLAGRSAVEVASLARRKDDTGIAVRYALRQLEPFAVVGADYSSARFPNGELELAGSSNERGMSDAWIAARAKFLEALVRYNTANGELSPAAIGGHFEDRQRNLRIGSTAVNWPHYIFGADAPGLPVIGRGADDYLIGGGADDIISGASGSDHVDGGGGADVIDGGGGRDVVWGGAGSDEMNGGDDNDRIFGGAGDDRLVGGAGDDRIEGGDGFDSYLYSSGDGHDIILDSDQSGKITYKGRVLSGGVQIAPRVYADAFGTRYELVGATGETQSLVIDGAMSVEDFRSGSLGIVLQDSDIEPTTPPDIAPVRYYEQRRERGTGIPYPRDAGSGSMSAFLNIYGSDASDAFTYTTFVYGLPAFFGRAGADLVQIAGAVGNTIVDGGASDDLIDASSSSLLVAPFVRPMVIAGGAGNDYLVGGVPGETIWGDNYRTASATPVEGQSAPIYFFDEFVFNVADYLEKNESNTAPETLAILRAAGAFVCDGPYDPSMGRMPRMVEGMLGTEGLLQYLQLEGWTFSGLEAAIDYILGSDPTFDDFIDAGAGNDTVHGGSGSDELFGGLGDDVLHGDLALLAYEDLTRDFGDLAAKFGAFGDDAIDGGDGNDQIFDLTGGNDTLAGGAGDDLIRSEEQAWSQDPMRAAFNHLDGGDGKDLLEVINHTEGGFDFVDGGAGDDAIYVRSVGDAYILGGEGNDSIGTAAFIVAPSEQPSETRMGGGGFHVDGGAGDDYYYVQGGTIHDAEGEDTMVVFIDSPSDAVAKFHLAWSLGRQPAALAEKVYREGDALVVVERSAYFGRELDHETRVADWFVGPASPIERVRYSESEGLGEPLALETWGSNYVGTSADEIFSGSEYSDRVLAGGGVDQVITEGGDDLIAGGAGDDVLDGGAGDDRYYYALGDGNDVIHDESGFDKLYIGAGIALSSVSVEREAPSTRLHIAGATLELIGGGAGAPGELPVDSLVFADGIAVALSDFLGAVIAITGSGAGDTLVGNDEANVIDGGAGNDLMYGGAGGDTYVFELGDGVDRIYDSQSMGEVNVVAFGPGISPDMLSLRSGSLAILVGADGDAIHLESVDANDIFGIHDVDLFRFADGTELAYSELLVRGLDHSGTPLDEAMLGSSADDRVFGAGGDDLLVDGEGDDTYFFGRGDGADTIVESRMWPGYSDTLVFTGDISVSDIAVTASGNDVVLRTGDDMGSVTIQGARLYDVVELIRFGDGTTWSGAELRARVAPPLNQAPVAEDDIASLTEDVSTLAVGNVLQNDADPDLGDTLSVADPGTHVGLYGTLELAEGGAFAYYLDNGLAQPLREGEEIQEHFSYAVSDGSASSPGRLVVSITGTNDAPRLEAPIPGQRAQAGVAFNFAFDSNTFGDVDLGDILALGAALADGSALPDWLDFEAAGRRFSGTPPADQVSRTLNIRVTATDSAGAVAAAEFALEITGGADQACEAILGTDHDEALFGTLGDDLIDGRGGYDEMSGGPGDDAYQVDRTGSHVDKVIEGPWAGHDSVYASTSYTLPANVEELHLLGYEGLEGRGNALANVLIGSSGDDRLFGLAGDDLLLDDAGRDWLDGGDGDDVLDGGRGNDTLSGGNGNDLYVHALGGGRDLVFDTGGEDAVRFGAGIDADDVAVRRSRNDLVLSLAAGREGVTLKDWFSSSSKRVERIEFADGTTWDGAAIRARIADGASEFENLEWSDGSWSRGGGDHRGRHIKRDHDQDRGERRRRGDDDDGSYDAIAARLRDSPDYDFTALAAYLQREGGGYGAMTPEEIANRWLKVQECVASLAPSSDDCYGGYGGHGDHGCWGGGGDWNGGWGYSGSIGRSGPSGGLQAFCGLDDGFRKL